MKLQYTNYNLYHILLLSTLFLQACTSSKDKIEEWSTENPPRVGETIDELIAAKGFNFQTTGEAEFNITSLSPIGEGTFPNVGFELYTTLTDGELSLFAKGNTDADGLWNGNLPLPVDVDSIRLKVTTPGYPQWHSLAVNQNLISYAIGSENTTGRVIENPLFDKTSSPASSSPQNGLASRSGFNYLGGVNNQGVPDYLTTPASIGPNVLDFVAINLPEGFPVPSHNAQYLEENISSNVIFDEPGELWISFVHEGAGYRNSIGYFTFDPDNPPNSVSDIDTRTILFPNNSFLYSGGGLSVGDRIYLGTFEAGTGVGWFLVPNGWNSWTRSVNESSSTRYSFENLNTFTSPESRSHALLLSNPLEEFLIVAFEDLNRPSGDNDFNDAVFLVEATPFTAINTDNTPEVVIPGNDEDNDGVPDHLDAYPLDDERAFISFIPSDNNYGTIAFEDLWPRKGDYDFNDMVINYSFIETLDANQRVKDIEISLQVRAMGASQNHGFAMRLPIDPQLIESVTGQELVNNYFTLNSNGTEAGTSMAVIPIFTDGFSLFETVETGGIVNTDPAKPKVASGNLTIDITFTSPINRELIGTAPYDPFMIRKQDRSLEIHLPGYAPTEKADLSLFNTADDRSNIEQGFYYVDSKNLPWAIHVPESFIYPQERVPISDVYANFATWATLGGASNLDWFRNTSANVNSNNGY